jgi:2-keto-3-deoxy-L-rhamnonate aldolase RhmA
MMVIVTRISEMRSPAIALIVDGAGFHFISVDMEHGAHTIETVDDLVTVARLAGVVPLVRVPDLTTSSSPAPWTQGPW